MTTDLDTRRTTALVSTQWLAAHGSAANVVIVDTRKGDGYAVSHIPGAVSVGPSPFLREDGDVIGAESFAALMSRLGVSNETLVIAYDDGNGLFAARLWWAARYYGHTHIQVLDGGWDRWLAEGRPVSDVPVVPEPAAFVAAIEPTLIASTDHVHASLGDARVAVLDVRGDDEWTRVQSEGTTVAGHIPGARHLVWSTVVDPETHRFRDGATLRDMFAAVGVEPTREVVPYCQAGIRAAHTMLALYLAGFDAMRNYEGSWAAWTRAAMPLEPYGMPRASDARRATRLAVCGDGKGAGDLVRARLAARFAGRDDVALVGDDTPVEAVDCCVALDAAATCATSASARRVDWSLLGGAIARGVAARGESALPAIADEFLSPRIDVLAALLDVPAGPAAVEFHASVRVHDLPRSVAFYAWLLNTWPGEWTQRYATFLRPDLGLNFVLLVADGNTLHHDTLYHVGIALADRAAVIDAYHRAVAFGARVVKPPRTTWRGTPLHELWLEDPDGTAVEIYARLSPAELAEMPADQEPVFLVAGTVPVAASA